MTKALLEYTHLEISYNDIPVVSDVSFSVMPGEIFCIVGESGSGKSSLIKAATGQLGSAGTITDGEVYYQEEPVSHMSSRRLRELCGSEYALVFQDCLSALTPIRRIRDLIYESASAHKRLSRTESDQAACRMFEKLALDRPERILSSYPFELSGGIGQRVGIAIALLSKPRILFADEPTSALDTINQAQVIELLVEINKEFNTTIVLVTHDMAMVERMADHVLELHNKAVKNLRGGSLHE